MKYFLDTNVISRFVSKDTDAVAKITSIASDDDNELFINELVYLEALRAIPITHKKLFAQTKEALDMCEKLDIPQEIYDKAVNFARFCKSKGVNLGKCEPIDYLHFMTAKHYGLAIVSYDDDMQQLQEKYEEFTQ